MNVDRLSRINLGNAEDTIERQIAWNDLCEDANRRHEAGKKSRHSAWLPERHSNKASRGERRLDRDWHNSGKYEDAISRATGSKQVKHTVQSDRYTRVDDNLFRDELRRKHKEGNRDNFIGLRAHYNGGGRTSTPVPWKEAAPEGSLGPGARPPSAPAPELLPCVASGVAS